MGRVHRPGGLPLVAALILVVAACGPKIPESLIAVRSESFRVTAVEIRDGAGPRVRDIAMEPGEEIRLDVSADGNFPVEVRALDIDRAVVARHSGTAAQLRDRGVMIGEDLTGATIISVVPRGGAVLRSWSAPEIVFAIADEADPIGPPSRAFDGAPSTFWRSQTPPRTQVTIAAAFQQTQSIAAVRASVVCTACGPIRLRVTLLRRAPAIPIGLAPPGSAQAVSLLDELLRDPSIAVEDFEIALSAADGGWVGGRVPSGPVAAHGLAITILDAPENIGFYEVEILNGTE